MRSLINAPEIVFADEPTGNLNSQASEEVMKCFVDLKAQGQSILMVTHDPKAASYADRICFMQDGTLIDELVFDKNWEQDEKLKHLLTWLQHKKW